MLKAKIKRCVLSCNFKTVNTGVSKVQTADLPSKMLHLGFEIFKAQLIFYPNATMGMLHDMGPFKENDTSEGHNSHSAHWALTPAMFEVFSSSKECRYG